MLGIYCVKEKPEAERIPFRDVYITPLVRDQYGKKMTKSRGNVVDPLEIMEKYGTDAVRFTLAQLAVQGRDLILSDDRLAASRAFANKIWNAARFVIMNLEGAPQPVPPVETARLGLAERWILSRLDNFDPSWPQVPLQERNVLDRWLLSRLTDLNKSVIDGLDHYDAIEPARRIQRFVDELSNWYIRRSRRRFWKSQSDSDKLSAYQTLYEALTTTAKLMGPFAPFIADAIYRNLSGGGSVHLADFPEPVSAADPKVEADMARARLAVEAGLAARDSARLKVRQPLASIALPGDPLPDDIAAIVRDELNVKNVTFDAPEVKLDTEITEELKLEGLAREVVRAIQDRRKKMGLNVEDRIDTRYVSDGMLVRALERHADYIKNETLSVTLAPGRDDGFDGEQMMLEGEQIWIGLKRN